MDCRFKEVSFERTERIMKFLAKDPLLRSDEFIIHAIGYWHSYWWDFRKLAKKYNIEIIQYHKPKVEWKKFLFYFLMGEEFFIKLNNADYLKEVHDRLMQFLSISYYIVDQKHAADFLAFVSRSRESVIETDADKFLENSGIRYLIYRINSDAPTESGFTEEVCYDDNTPKDWLAYF